MKLAYRFALAFVLVTVAVWGIASWIRIGREEALFDADMRRDHEQAAVDLASAVARIRDLGGDSAAYRFVEEANASKGNVSIRLVVLDTADHAGVETILYHIAIAGPGQVVHMLTDSLGERWLESYSLIPGESARPVAVELIESLSEQEAYVHQTVVRSVVWAIALSVLAGLLALVLGAKFVGRPVQMLIDKARRVAAGDLSGRVELRQMDELGALAVELNAMSDRLAEAWGQVAVESAERRKALEQLRHADRLTTVGKLASAVAHELRSPLTVTKYLAESIASGEIEGSEIAETNAVILRQVNQMSKITRGLLDFGKRQATHKERGDLAEVVRQTVDVVEPLARKQRVRVRREFGEGPLGAVADMGQVRQVLSNLMMNAVDAMPDGGEVTVELSQREVVSRAAGSNGGGDRGEFAVLRVADTGVGIPRELAEKIFDPFFTTKDREKGTGLGLSICSEIVREHGGWIEVESEVGEGAKFTVYLPVRAG